MSEYSVILSTFLDRETAKKVAKLLVQQKLAACVQLLPAESIYFWQNELYDHNEIILIIKSRTDFFDKIAAVIKENHSYQIPQIVQLPIADGLSAYLDWIGKSVQ